jgi:hypothetical protein
MVFLSPMGPADRKAETRLFDPVFALARFCKSAATKAEFPSVRQAYTSGVIPVSDFAFTSFRKPSMVPIRRSETFDPERLLPLVLQCDLCGSRYESAVYLEILGIR